MRWSLTSTRRPWRSITISTMALMSQFEQGSGIGAGSSEAKRLKSCWPIICARFRRPIKTAVRNNGGGHANHSLFWNLISTKGGGAPKGEIENVITSTFGSFDSFKEKFNAAATAVSVQAGLGSSKTSAGKFEILSNRQSRQPVDGRQEADPGPGCLGTRLLSQVSESPS